MDFLHPENDRSTFTASEAGWFDGHLVADIKPLANASVTDLITLVVIARAAAVRSMDYALADEYLKLACVGHMKPAIYAAVLGQAG